MDDIIKLHKEIIEAQKKLNALVEQEDGEYEKIFNKSVKTDKVIAKYIKAKANLENERNLLMKKYEKELETPFKNEIIAQIRTEVRLKYPEIGVKELLHFSTNVYIYATLLAHNISEQEILEQLVYLNNIYFEDIQENDDILQNCMIDSDLEYLKYLKEKYIKIIKERI